tara:strand:+ start:500 stop:622 length:123 start_codon:yes stop_codon:yes gene_type:complete
MGDLNDPFTLLLQDHGRDEENYISFRIWMRKLSINTKGDG